MPVNVMVHSTNGVHQDVLVLANAGGVRPPAFLHFCWDNFPPLFCAESDMHYILKIGVRQGVAPPALNIAVPQYGSRDFCSCLRADK
jgi:hypothetical protein